MTNVPHTERKEMQTYHKSSFESCSHFDGSINFLRQVFVLLRRQWQLIDSTYLCVHLGNKSTQFFDVYALYTS